MTRYGEATDNRSDAGDEPFANLSDNVHENTYLNAARRLGIPFRVIDGAGRYWMLGEPPGVLLRRASLGVDSEPLRQLLRDKAASQSLLSAHGIPVPEFVYHRLTRDLKTCYGRLLEFASPRYPVVVKPNAGREAIGVYTNVRSERELARALGRQVKRGVRGLIVERHVAGDSHRGILLEGELIDTVRWEFSTIVGDGQSTVRDLLAALNATDPEFREIRVHDRLLEILGKHGLSLSCVPAAGDRVKVVDAGAYRGARRYRIPPASIPEENARLLGGIGRLVGARLLGVDFICQDVTVPWTDQEFHVNEINGAPGFGLHYPGTSEHDLETVSRILKRVFPDAGRGGARREA